MHLSTDLDDLIAASGSQPLLSANGQPAPKYDKWTLKDYATRDTAGRCRFWDKAPIPAIKAMVRMILELSPDHPTRKQAVEKGWLDEEEKVN